MPFRGLNLGRLGFRVLAVFGIERVTKADLRSPRSYLLEWLAHLTSLTADHKLLLLRAPESNGIVTVGALNLMHRLEHKDYRMIHS